MGEGYSPRQFITTQSVYVCMSERDTERPVTAKGYKGPRWLINALPRVGTADDDDE